MFFTQIVFLMWLSSHAAIPPENTNWRYLALHGGRNIKNVNQIFHFWKLGVKGFQTVYRLSKSADILEEALSYHVRTLQKTPLTCLVDR